MRSVLAGLRRLIIPWGAPATAPRIVIGQDVPPELAAWYLANRGIPVVAAILYYTAANAYYYDVDLTSTLTTEHSHGRGVVENGNVHEFEFLRFFSGTLFNYHGLFDPFFAVYGRDAAPDPDDGVTFNRSLPVSVFGDLMWGLSRTLSAFISATGTTTSNAYTSVLTGAGAVSQDFYAPPSGQVMLHWRATGQVTASFGTVSPGVNLFGGAAVVAPSDDRAVQFNNTVQMGFGASSLITGLTPNTQYTATLFHRCAAGSTFTLLRRELIVAAAI